MDNVFENFNSEEITEELDAERNKNQLIQESHNKDTVHKGVRAMTPAYELFEERFYEENPECTEEDLEFVIRKKKGVPYINFECISRYNMPDGECLGVTLLEKRKFTGKPVTSYVHTGRKYQKIYDTLPTTPIGAIPVADGYIAVTRRKTNIFNIVTPVLFFRILVFSILGV